MARVVKISVCLFLITIFYCCKKEETTHYYISDAFKRWTVFNKGSFWIFQNDSTLETDSTYIKSNPISFDVPSSNSNYNCTSEKIEVPYSSAFLGKAILRLNLYGQQTTMYLYVNDFDSYGLIASSLDNFIPYVEDTFTNTTYETVSLDTVYYLGVRKFYNVVNAKISINSQVLKIAYAKDIGVIKVIGENTDNDFSWSLLRFHIER